MEEIPFPTTWDITPCTSWEKLPFPQLFTKSNSVPISLSGATCPIAGWNCYCGWKYAMKNDGHGYETSGRGGAMGPAATCTGWCQLKDFLFSPRTLGNWSNLTCSYFFKWVGEKPPTSAAITRSKTQPSAPILSEYPNAPFSSAGGGACMGGMFTFSFWVSFPQWIGRLVGDPTGNVSWCIFCRKKLYIMI